MSSSTFDLHEKEFRRIEAILHGMYRELRAETILLTSRGGQTIMTAGNATNIDNTVLASLAAAEQSTADALAGALGEIEFPVLMHQGRQRSLLISTLRQKFLLVLVFNTATSTGLVRYKCQQCLRLLEEVMRDCRSRMENDKSAAEPLNFTDEELAALLGE